MSEENDTLETTASEETEEVAEETPVDEAVTEETVAEEAEPEHLYAGKYKSVEELEKAYQEEQKILTRQAQEQARIRKQVEQVLPFVSPPSQQEDVQPSDETEAARQLIGGIVREALQEQFGPLQMQSQVQSFAERHADLEEYLPEIVSKFEAMTDQQRGLLMQANPNFLEDAYYAAKGMRSGQVVEEAKKQGKKEVYEAATKKREAQPESADSVSRKASPKFTQSQVDRMTPEEYAKNADAIFAQAVGEGLPEE